MYHPDKKNVNSFSPQKSDTYLSRSRHLEAYLGCHVCLFKAGAAGVRLKEKLLESHFRHYVNQSRFFKSLMTEKILTALVS